MSSTPLDGRRTPAAAELVASSAPYFPDPAIEVSADRGRIYRSGSSCGFHMTSHRCPSRSWKYPE